MRLIDIVLESEAAKEAAKLGLVKKPGVALYGPPGDENPATHRSRGGKLVPLSSRSASQATGQSSATSSPSDTGKSPPSDDSSVDDKPTQFPTIDEISQRVRDTFTPDGRVGDVQQTLSAVTSQFGRETCAPVHLFGPDFYAMSSRPPIHWNYIAGTFLYEPDIIGLRREVPDKPISEYDADDVRAFKTAAHEALHAARWRSDSVPSGQIPPIWKHFTDHPMGARLDEGMTEYLAREITSTTLTDTPTMVDFDWEQHGSYPEETNAVRFMVEYGNFDVTAAYQNHSFVPNDYGGEKKPILTTGENNWEYMDKAYEAQHTAIIEILTRAGFTEEDLQGNNVFLGILSALESARKQGVFIMMFPKVMELLKALVDSNFQKPANPVNFINSLNSVMNKAISEVVVRQLRMRGLM
jgi:hypothetical protein